MLSTTLSSQLKAIKQQALVKKLDYAEPPSSLLFSTAVSRTVDLDLLYTFAMVGYDHLKDHILCLPAVTVELLSEHLKGMNRNHLTLEENNLLSRKIKMLLLGLSPFLLSEECQKILDYIMRNFSSHIFEAEAMALMYVMHFESPVYAKLIANISLDTHHLAFLKYLLRGFQKINFEYLVKAFEHDRFLLNTITEYTTSLLAAERQEETVNLGLVEEQVVRYSHLSFVSKIWLGLFARNPNKWAKELIKFGFEVLKVSSSEECVEMVLTLLLTVLIQVNVQENFVSTFVNKFITKSYNVSPLASLSLFHFILFCWEKYPHLFTTLTVKEIVASPLRKYLLRPKAASCAVFLCLTRAFFEGVSCTDILKALSLHVKEDQLIVNNTPLQEMFYNEVFDVYASHPNLREVEDIEEFEKMVKEEMAFEFASYVNRSKRTVENRILYKIFNKKQLEANGKVSMKGLSAKALSEQPAHRSNPMEIEQEESSGGSLLDLEVQQAEPTHVQSILRSMQIEQNKQTLIQLVSDYYSSSSPPISSTQKNIILEKLDQNICTDSYLIHDIRHRDWTQPLTHIKTSSNLVVLKEVMNVLVEDEGLLEDIVYKDLLKQTFVRLGVLSRGEYKNIVNVVSEFGDELVRRLGEEDTSKVQTVYEILLFASSQIIKNNGVVKGKLFRLILVLIKVLNIMLNSSLYGDKLPVLFKQVLFLFEERNLYIFFIGFASLISKMKFDSLTITKLRKVLLQVYFQEDQKGAITLLQAWSRAVGFCSSLVEKAEGFKENPQNVVPKKILTDLFGLIKPKEKTRLARNIIFITRYIILSQDFSASFIQQLSHLQQHQRAHLVQETIDLFSAALAIQTHDEKVQSGLVQVLHDVAVLYPLELIVRVITPLLPNNELYSILLEKLKPHPRFRGRALDEVLRVKPEVISEEWLQIATICLDRGCKVSQEFVELLLEEQSAEALALIAQISKHEKSLIIPHLDVIIQKLFQREMRIEYHQAITQTFVNSLKGLLDPYLSTLIQFNVRADSPFSERLLQSIAHNFEIGSVLEVTRTIKPSTSTEHINFSSLLKEICKLGHGSKIVSVFYNVMLAVTQSMVDDESNLEELLWIQSLQVQAFETLCLKLRPAELDPVLNNLAIWSEKTVDSPFKLNFSVRKLVAVKIFSKLSQTMKDLFLNYHKYLFDSLILDLGHMNTELEAKPKKEAKRQLQTSPRGVELVSAYIKETLAYFQSLFSNDTEESFIDAVRFEKLSRVVSNMFTWNPSNTVQNYLSYIQTQLSPSLLALCEMTKDDYKLKTLNANILEKLSLSNSLVNHGVFLFLNEEMSGLGDRNLVLFNDLLPYLAEYRESRDKDVQGLCRKLIAQIEQMSGEKIDQYFHN